MNKEQARRPQACWTAHCPSTETHFLPGLSRPRGTEHPKGRPSSETVPALLTAEIRSDSAHIIWPHSRSPADVSAPAAAEERGRQQAWEQTMLSSGSQEEGMDPSHRFKPQPALISKSCILNALTSEMWKTGTIAFQSQPVEKEVTMAFWPDPKGMGFKRRD